MTGAIFFQIIIKIQQYCEIMKIVQLIIISFFISVIWTGQNSFAQTLPDSEEAEKSDDKKAISTHPEQPPVALRGDDIGEVSRIVMDGIPEKGYKLRADNNKLHILFTDFAWSFLKEDMDALRFLKNIDKITYLIEDNLTVLTIVYNCPCQADVYKWHDKKLVIDVFSLDAVSNPAKVKPDMLQEAEKQEAAQEKKAKEELQPQASQDSKPLKTDSVKDFEKNLKKLLSAAEEQGIVTLKPKTEPVKDVLPTEVIEKIILESKPQIKLAELKPEIKIDVERKFENIPDIQTQTLLPTDKDIFKGGVHQCLPDAAFQLPPNDPASDTFYDKLTDYRGKLIGEFDENDTEMSLKLAQHYISYGLGEEAIETLKVFGAPEHRGYIAQSMAELLTNRTPSSESVFAESDKCHGVQALWAAYRYYRMGDENKAKELSDFPEAPEMIATLPVTLQKDIGTALALNLVRGGSYKTAEAMIDEIAKKTNQFDHSVLLVRGLIDVQNGLSDRALETLEEVMTKTTGLDQQMAALALSELKLAMNKPLSVRDVSALEEMVFLKSRELTGARALALIAENESRYGNFFRAFHRLSENIFHEDGVKDPVTIKSEQLFRRLAVAGEGLENPNNFNVYYQYKRLLPDDPFLHVSFAKKLYDYGHDDPALNIVETMEIQHPDYFVKHDESYFKGKILFRLGRYEEALMALDKPYIDDKEYMSLKAEALYYTGNYQEAYNALLPFKDTKSDIARARYALAAKQWDFAQKAYESASVTESNPDFYYGAKASGYMSGHQYPGDATQYEKTTDIVFHQPDKQAKAIEDIVKETDKIIELVKERHEKISPLFDKAETLIMDNSIYASLSGSCFAS